MFLFIFVTVTNAKIRYGNTMRHKHLKLELENG